MSKIVSCYNCSGCCMSDIYMWYYTINGLSAGEKIEYLNESMFWNKEQNISFLVGMLSEFGVIYAYK